MEAVRVSVTELILNGFRRCQMEAYAGIDLHSEAISDELWLRADLRGHPVIVEREF
jgi:hypothetical protein